MTVRRLPTTHREPPPSVLAWALWGLASWLVLGALGFALYEAVGAVL